MCLTGVGSPTADLGVSSRTPSLDSVEMRAVWFTICRERYMAEINSRDKSITRDLQLGGDRDLGYISRLNISAIQTCSWVATEISGSKPITRSDPHAAHVRKSRSLLRKVHSCHVADDVKSGCTVPRDTGDTWTREARVARGRAGPR